MTSLLNNYMNDSWNIGEEVWKRKAKSLEEQCQKLISDNQDIRLEKAKLLGELRVLQRYKENTEDVVSKEVTSRKLVEKEKLSMVGKYDQALKRYEQECDKTLALERENSLLKDELKSFKDDTKRRLDLLHDLDDAQVRSVRQKEKLRDMEVKQLQYESTILELRDEITKLKLEVQTSEERAAEKSADLKSTKIRLAAVESAWETSRGENRTVRNELQKKESVVKDLESVKQDTKKVNDRLESLEIELETKRVKLHQRDELIDELQASNTLLKAEITRLTTKVEDLMSTISMVSELNDEKEREIRRKDEILRCKSSEVKSLSKVEDNAKERIQDLTEQVVDLQSQLLVSQKEFVQTLKKEEYNHEKQRAKDRLEMLRDMDILHKPRRCKKCGETFTNKHNTPLSCTYHPGRYEVRLYPLEGYQWTCCHKRDLAARPCKFAGKHIEVKSLD